jgi:DNA-directed RNA polymerase specialized sigma24 family protein
MGMSPARSALIEPTRERSFSDFLRRHEPGLRRALVARYGPEIGREAAADALTYGWEHWDRLGRMANPAGYLYRVGQSKSRRFRRRRIAFPAPEDHGLPWVEPALAPALAALPARQRQTVVLVHGFAYTHAEVADLLGLSRSSVQKHVERGLTALRARLEVSHA